MTFVVIILLIICYTVTWQASQGLDKCVYQSDITSGHHWQYYQIVLHHSFKSIFKIILKFWLFRVTFQLKCVWYYVDKFVERRYFQVQVSGSTFSEQMKWFFVCESGWGLLVLQIYMHIFFHHKLSSGWCLKDTLPNIMHTVPGLQLIKLLIILGLNFLN